MFKSFMDESSTHLKDRACVVAGFAGTEVQCDRIAEEWKVLVKPLVEFHALEFFPRNPDGSMTGIYKEIPVEDAERHVFALVDLLSGSSLESIGMALDTDAFKTLSEDERRWMTSAVLYGKSWPSQGAPNTPYLVPFHYCVSSANEYTPPGEKMYMTFDRNESLEGAAKRTYNDLLGLGGKWSDRLAETIVFSSRHEAVLLQASDLLSYVMAWNVTYPDISDTVAKYAFDRLAKQKAFVRAMDIQGIDFHLRKCPFRRTFWEGFTEPDLIEFARAKGLNVLASKAEDGRYLTHHIKRNKVTVMFEIKGQPLGGLNRIDRREDSINHKDASAETSLDDSQASQTTSSRQSGDKPS